MNKKPIKMNSFLVEIIIVAGFFSVISAMLLMVYVKTDQLRLDAKNITRGTILAQSVIEECKGIADVAKWAEGRSGVVQEGAAGWAYREYYDASWQSTGSEEDVFYLEATWDEVPLAAGSMADLQVAIMAREPLETKALCVLSTSIYSQGQ